MAASVSAVATTNSSTKSTMSDGKPWGALVRSPVSTTSLPPAPPARSGGTSQPARRTLFSRLFRTRTSRHHRVAYDAEESASPSSHQSTPTSYHYHRYQQHLHQQQQQHEQQELQHNEPTPPIPRPHMTRASSAPNHASDGGLQKDAVKRMVLMEGALVKISSAHRYWHAKATFFVLEEEMTALPSARQDLHSRIWLRQYRKAEDARRDRERQETRRLGRSSSTAVLELALSEHDVVVDISDRHIQYGIELLHRNPDQTRSSHDRGGGGAVSLQSLRLSASDSEVHHLWMRVLGAAIARLMDQSKRHYPIVAPDLVFTTTTPSPGEGALVQPTGSAKVVPIAMGQDDGDDDHNNNNDGDDFDSAFRSDRPEHVHDEEPRAPSFCISDCFSSEATSSNNDNNDDDGDHSDGQETTPLAHPPRSLFSPDNNQHDDDVDDVQAHAQRASECSISTHSTCYSPSEVDLTRTFHSSPNVPTSLVSTPSPHNNYHHNGTTLDDDESSALRDLAASMASASLLSPNSPPPPGKYAPTTLVPTLPPPRSMMMMRPHVHSFNANGQVFTLDVRYRLLKSIGTGAYGAVIAVKDTVTDTSVAVKKITKIFDDLVDAKRILREVRLLRHFHHKNIPSLLDLAPPMTKKSLEDMYIITDLMETDLHQVIYSMQPMSDDHVKYFLYQMLCALHHIHSAGVLHRDMKPSNILLNSNCDLKVCDFGLARGGLENRESGKLPELTEYVVTRWYRAPEIMLNCLNYTTAIDVWAVGCIFAEMLLREPLFPGNDYIHQLKLIIKFLGTPKQEDIAFVKNVKALRFLTKLAISKPKKWREVFTADDVNPLALDLLSQMLMFNPEKRISVQAALQHPYLATFYDVADITEAPPFDFSFDIPDDKLTKDALVDLLCEDIGHFHPKLLQQYRVPPPSSSMSPATAGANGPSSSRYFSMTALAS